MEQIVYGNIRVQFFGADIVRIEYGENGKFCDQNTLFIPDKTRCENVPIAYAAEGGVLRFGAYKLYLPANAKSLHGVKLEKSGKNVYTYKPIKNSGELPALNDTPEVFALSDTPRILVPTHGYTYVNGEPNGGYVIEENVEDIYLLLCDRNAKKLRRLYVELTGRNELVRLSTLGCWNSKYYEYNEESAKQLITDYERYDIPLDVMVIDTDWRAASERGIGYDVNLNLFPDMKRFIDFAHSRGVEIVFNDHPEPTEGTHSVFSPREIEYREIKLQGLMMLGLDTWWYDRNWHTALLSPSENLAPETLGMYLYTDITKHFYQLLAENDTVYRRPVIMGNVNNICGGRYEKDSDEYCVRDSASHRYSVQWTGDIYSDADTLAQEISNLVQAGNNAISYINSDCGGHVGNPGRELYLRWIQFGTLSPVFRPHCCKGCIRYREPWVYDTKTLHIAREYIKMRYRLLPVIYTNAYVNYLTGEPIFKSLGFAFPNDKTAVCTVSEYMLGNNILISPLQGKKELATEEKEITDVRETYLPAGKWMDVFDGVVYEGEHTVRKKYDLQRMPLFVRLGALIPLAQDAKNTRSQKWDTLFYDFYPSKEFSDSGFLYEDDGETTAYKSGSFRTCAYDARYCEGENAYVVRLYKGQGLFDGGRFCTERKIILKIHLTDDEVARSTITVNDKMIPFARKPKKIDAFPFGASPIAPDSDVIVLEFETKINEEYEIKIRIS